MKKIMRTVGLGLMLCLSITITAQDVKSIENKTVISIRSDGDSLRDDKPKPLFVVDGKKLEKGAELTVEPSEIERINVYKGEKAIKEYGNRGENGVVVIFTKKYWKKMKKSDRKKYEEDKEKSSKN